MIDNQNGTVTDERTGLMWQQEFPEAKMTWEQAVSYCKELNLAGHNDWRLPTIQELKSIVDYIRYNPVINIGYFPNTGSSFYWSSTTHAYYTGYAWGVYLYNGYDYCSYKYSSYYVRAVRGGI
jgi:hypothetical protein